MKNNKQLRALRVNRETIVQLAAPRLKEVAAGVSQTVDNISYVGGPCGTHQSFNGPCVQ